MRSIARSWLGAAAAACLAFAAPGCTGPVVALREEVHPEGGAYLVSATFEEWPGGFYSTPVTIRNRSDRRAVLHRGLFRLEGTSPTAFVPASTGLLIVGEMGYQMPDFVPPLGSAQGEVFWEIRGTSTPHGPVRLCVDLPDGEHTFTFSLIQ